MAWNALGSFIGKSFPILRLATQLVFFRRPSLKCSTNRGLGIDISKGPSVLIADAVKRSSIAHLFQFYPLFCEIASIPRKTPSAWVMAQTSLPRSSPIVLSANARNGKDGESPRSSIVTGTGERGEGSDDQAIELDARVLARGCLLEVGKEMGVSNLV